MRSPDSGADGRFLRINHKLCDFLGYLHHELLRKRFQDVTYCDDLTDDRALLRRAIDGEIKTFSMDKCYIRGNGAIIWADLTVSLVRDASDRPNIASASSTKFNISPGARGRLK
ncbi:MAG TPA: PAS domain S-box protein [Stellaceae bacterium]|nr:PAS domain S-box protein [Stellaceae bacterium]